MARSRPNLALAPDPEPVTPRDVLRRRHREWDAAHQGVRKAEAMLARGRAEVEKAEARVATGADAEARIRAHRLQAVKSGKSGADPLPEMLQSARAVHRDAQDGLADARAVIAALEGELEAARDAYTAIGKAVEVAAQEVVRSEDAPRVAAALRDAQARAHDLHRQLTGLASIHVYQNPLGYSPGLVGTPFEVRVGPMHLPPEVGAALNPPTDGLNRLMGDNSHIEAWRAYFRALMQDADATPPV